MGIYRIEITAAATSRGAQTDSRLADDLREAGLHRLSSARTSRLFFIEGALSQADAEQLARAILVDPVTESMTIVGEGGTVPLDAGTTSVEVHLRPGVMDPVAESTLAELRGSGYAVDAVRTARRLILEGELDAKAAADAALRTVANDCIEQVISGTAGVRPAPRPPTFEFRVRHVALRGLSEGELEQLSRKSHLFLSIAEMRAIQAHFAALGREPTDLELETIAQTWSEHCVHKTLKSAFAYRGAPLPRIDGARPPVGEETRHYDNLLRDTIARVTRELTAARRGPECLSVFQDNAGVIGFDVQYGVAFKVETHNHPSAIEPYGGAATGIGGVIRDVIGCGLGAKPIASTDVFCVAPADWPMDRLPAGVLHPWRVLRGVVRGVADYGNRMGIPTVNGAVYFDPRYLGNPLVYCGSVGLIPRDRIEKAARPGDAIVVVGGRTGRDGIHGATFSSAELTDTHADEFSHAVQIGNAITEKRMLDAIMQARDDAGGCLYTAITDCGAGGLSSAIGEMGAEVGAAVDLERVPLKYAGLRYDEIWISEAQERMVVAVPRDRLDRFMAIMTAEGAEATVVGVFGTAEGTAYAGSPRLIVRYQGAVVGDLDAQFLQDGIPMDEKAATWVAPDDATMPSVALQPRTAEAADLDRLVAELARPTVASKAWIIRLYDHEVQGGSAVKPLLGRGDGPGDAAVVRPRLDSRRGIVVGCGLAPALSDVDPYWMAAASIDEAVRNVVCVGGDPGRLALLDNFCWGRTDDPRQLGGLVRACQACYDVASLYGTPFISGKDSLNNEFALDEADVEPLIETLQARARADGVDAARWRAILPAVAARLRERRRLAIPQTLLISALALVDDVERCCTSDLKQSGNVVLLLGGLPPVGFDAREALRVHQAVAEMIASGAVRGCHDISDGGWLTALAEMAIAGRRGAEIVDKAPHVGPFDECVAGYLVETDASARAQRIATGHTVACRVVGRVSDRSALSVGGRHVELEQLAAAWATEPRRGRV